ncbi:MAG TPA: glutamine-hydrolyzing carbamoyl-phosphate synthase small subunit [Myxococcales bacterium]|jgi:carbamoyl-phosphate synthase small subunit
MSQADTGVLVLEDGRSFAGQRFGARGDAGGEVVFNTAMTGYQEILGDPSYAGQIVVMTYPMIGNYGITPEDFESSRVYLSALVVKEPSRVASNWRHERTLDAFLADQRIPGLWGLDTRALVRHLRDRGAMRGIIADASTSEASLVERARAVPSMAGQDLASAVSTRSRYEWTRPRMRLDDRGVPARPARFRVVVYDFGVKRNILRSLVDVGCRVTVVPASTSAAEVLALRPDGVVLSNGPGDPEPLREAVKNVRALLGQVPIFGICLGHQLLALAGGARTFKLKFGHHGANHPVLDQATGRVEITSQNHGFAVDPASLPAALEQTHRNLNDGTCAGLRFRDLPAFSVQYHPEAAPGPHDAHYLFERFVDLMREGARPCLGATT